MSASRPTRFAVVTACFIGAFFNAACGSSTSTVTAPSTISRCGVTLGAGDATIPAEGGTGRITVTTARECAWSAASDAGWLSISGPNSGQGDGAIEYRVGSNGDPVTRRGGITLNDRKAEITQSAGTCVYQLRQHSAGYAQSGGNGTIDVVASSPMCTWTATSDSDWISITSSPNGKGTASIAYIVAGTSGPPRTGTLTVAEQRFSVTQSEGCTYSIAPQEITMGASGGTDSIRVTTGAGCPWNRLSNVPWIQFTQEGSSSGSGSATLVVDRTTGPTRTGTLVVAGQPFAVTQTSGCSYQVSPQTHSAPGAGGTFDVNVTTPTGCGWSVASDSPWITVLGAASGSGGGQVTMSVETSTGSERTGRVSIGNQTVIVTQAQGCSYALSSESQTVGASGGSGSVNVTGAPGCAWTASSNAEWIGVTSGSPGSGNGTVNFTVAALVGPTRTGTMTIAGRAFSVTQTEGCSLTLDPELVRVGEAGGSRSFNVQTSAACAWTAVSDAPWITITSGGSSTGNGTVQLQIAPHTGERRTGTVAVSTAGVAPKTATIQQDSGCSVTFSAAGTTMPPAGGAGSVDVTTDATCDWRPRTDETWITISSPGQVFGNGTVTFNVAANAGPARIGAIRAGGRTFQINQESGCTYAVAPAAVPIAAAGGPGIFNVTSGAACSWTAVPDVLWITISGSATGAGDGAVNFNVQPNTGAARSGTITVQGQVVTINQAGM